MLQAAKSWVGQRAGWGKELGGAKPGVRLVPGLLLAYHELSALDLQHLHQLLHKPVVDQRVHHLCRGHRVHWRGGEGRGGEGRGGEGRGGEGRGGEGRGGEGRGGAGRGGEGGGGEGGEGRGGEGRGGEGRGGERRGGEYW